MVASISRMNFKSEVEQSAVPVLVDFYATWCGPCRLQHPVLADLENESGGKYKIVKVDTDQEPGLSSQFAITALPTLLVFRGGRIVERLVGLQNAGSLRRILAVGDGVRSPST